MFILYLLFMLSLMVLALPMRKICTSLGLDEPCWKFCIPLYNLRLLHRASELSAWVLYAALFAALLLPFTPLSGTLVQSILPFTYFALLSASLARAFKANTLLWALAGGLLFFIPLFTFSSLRFAPKQDTCEQE